MALTKLAALALLVPCAALAHGGEAVRTLRLQRGPAGFEALLTISVPPGVEAQTLLAPAGLVPGEEPGQPVAELLGKRAAALGLRGLHLSIGADERSLRPLTVEAEETKARKTQAGGVEGVAILRFSGALPPGAAVLELDAPSGPTVRATLAAPAGFALGLLAGVGRAAAGGLALRPRPGRPCRVQISPAVESNSPR